MNAAENTKMNMTMNTKTPCNFGPCLSGALTLLLGAGLWAGGAMDTLAKDKEKDSKNPPLKLEIDSTPTPREGRFVSSYSHVVKKISPSVVKVTSISKARASGGQRNPLMDDPFFRRFFGEDPNGRMPRAPREQGLGSGVIVTKDGYILTNNHVVENADVVKVSIGSDEKEYTAEVIGKDDKTDIAVIKIDAKDLTPATAADSDILEVGDVVLAVGNPFGLGETVTMGVVSATGRVALGLEYENFIQTDASINPGNSGGALVDAMGRLVGINTAILSRSGGNQGIGFAVPINLARFVMESLVREGRVVRGFMGAMLQPVNSALAKQFQLGDASGALVSEVMTGTPASKAGLKEEDIILELDGKAVKDSRTLRLQISQIAPGTKVVLKVLRAGEKRKLDLVLGERPDNLASSGDRGGKDGNADALDGVTVADLDRATRAKYGIPAEVKGAVVIQVDEESASAEAGLKVGDVVREINRQPVTSADEAVELSGKAKEDAVLLRVWSSDGNGRGSNRYIVVQDAKSKK